MKLLAVFALAAQEMSALQSAEKLVRAVGRGFIPGKKPNKMNGVLAPEECSPGFLQRISPSSALFNPSLIVAYGRNGPASAANANMRA